jgi:hypothetical protein
VLARASEIWGGSTKVRKEMTHYDGSIAQSSTHD